MSDDTQKIDLLQETKRHLNSGTKVFNGRYELIRELGSGGMGVVWLANDLEVKDRVALKFLPGLVRDPEAERDLREEVKNARNLVHEHIVGVRTLLTDEKTIAVEMEYVDGPNVIAQMAAEPTRCLSLEKTSVIVRGLCLAIDYAWNPPRRVVHRDIKPHNLLVNSTGQLKVVDFGIAHAVSETVTRITGRTANDKVVGTLPYMSPQQLRGEVSHSNDVYSIGATLFHMLTGTPPFRATDATMLTRQITDEAPPSMTERRKQLIQEGRPLENLPAIPKVWEEVVAACLSKNAAERPQSAREIAYRLGLVAQLVSQTGAQAMAPSTRKSQWTRWALGATLVLTAGAAGWYWVEVHGNRPPQLGTAQTADAVPSAGAPNPDTPATTTKAIPQRTGWQLIASQPTTLSVAYEADGKTIFSGNVIAGQKLVLPVGSALLLQTPQGATFATEIDGVTAPLPPVPSNRWSVLVSGNASETAQIVEAAPPPPPFEAEVGPLVKAGLINKEESEWLRAALGGEHGETERSLATALVDANPSLTPGQWRAHTTLKFKPDAAMLLSDAPAQQARAIDIVLPPGGAEMRLLRVEAGQFLRGAPGDEIGRRPSDRPVSQSVIAKPFFLGIYEVSQAQYEAVMKRSPSYWRGNPNWPVDQITWNDLMAKPQGFLAKLNAALEKTYGGVLVADIPTEDEWEYACRATTTTAFNNDQPISNIESDPALDAIAHYNKSNGAPRPVGSFAPNKWGFYDMHGNLQEWTQDRFLRGGSWDSKAAACRSASRNQTTREAGPSKQTGFRLVLRLRDPAEKEK
jgi:serine/threonine protein kinase/formylglycine-generating enzyme required for sulfatase activity